jgi:hypothetical protein
MHLQRCGTMSGGSCCPCHYCQRAEHIMHHHRPGYGCCQPASQPYRHTAIAPKGAPTRSQQAAHGVIQLAVYSTGWSGTVCGQASHIQPCSSPPPQVSLAQLNKRRTPPPPPPPPPPEGGGTLACGCVHDHDDNISGHCCSSGPFYPQLLHGVSAGPDAGSVQQGDRHAAYHQAYDPADRQTERTASAAATGWHVHWSEEDAQD